MIRPGTRIECTEKGPHGGRVVASIGYVGDWAAYEQCYPDQTTVETIAKNGDKIGEDQARILFPELKEYSWRR